ncbi:hypothetical protein ACFLSG_04640 [Candidatus Bipolaricaulota bacterium]
MVPDQEVRDYAAKLARQIDDGDGPSFVWGRGSDKIQVVMGRASPPRNLPSSLSLGQWRNQLRPAIAEELSKLGWEIKGGNRFWRTDAGGPERTRRAAPVTQESAEQKRIAQTHATATTSPAAISSDTISPGFILAIVAIAVVLVIVVLSGLTDSKATRRKIYYDMIKTQDQDMDSPAWDQDVKEAAADYYDMPMSEINDIIMEGATEGWLQPDPP